MKHIIILLGSFLSILLSMGLGGKPGMTFSTRNYIRYLDGKWNLVPVINYIFLKLTHEEDHCYKSWLKWKFNTSKENKLLDKILK